MARQNKRGLELSFKRSGDGSKGRWYTRVGGKPIYFGWGNGVSDRESYQTALEAYRAWQDAQREQKQQETRGPVPSSLGVATWKEAEHVYDAWHQSKAKAEAAVTKSDEQAASKLIDSWLADQKRRNERRHWVEQQQAEGKLVKEGARENLSDGRYSAYLIYGEHFKNAVGEMKWDGKEATCAAILKAYRDKCETLLHEGKNKPNTFNERMKTVRAFVTWADENYKLDRVPRAIVKLTAKYQYVPSAKAIPVDVIQAIWGVADVTMKAYMTLALNCGYYARDISVLDALDIQSGRIIRDRNKTGVPTNYKLWNVTQRLIGKVGNAQGKVFLGIGGKALVYHVGKTRVDAIADRWDRLMRKLVDDKVLTEEQTDYSFSNLRDSAITFVEDQDKSLSDMFAAHKDRRQAAYYIDSEALQTPQKKLDAIVDQMEKHFGLKWEEEQAAAA